MQYKKNGHGSYFIDSLLVTSTQIWSLVGEISTLAMIQWKDVQYNDQKNMIYKTLDRNLNIDPQEQKNKK